MEKEDILSSVCVKYSHVQAISKLSFASVSERGLVGY